MRMSEGGWRRVLVGLISTAAFGLTSTYAAACAATHDPSRSTENVTIVNVQVKPGERCVIQGGEQEQPWFRRAEKMSAHKGRYGRLIHELHNKSDPTRARWQYVYVSPRNWAGQDSVSLHFAVPAIEIRYEIVVQ
jgi:hypothetical protein